MTIYVLSGFNNYYNRIVKKFDTINEYVPYSIHTQQNYNFVPNDYVNTQVVLGSNVNTYDGTGDYLLAVNELNEIDSRWFIIESSRDRAGQYTLTLHRDLIADYFIEIISEDCFIEKATLTREDPLIYNQEDITVNQIKQSEVQLKDESGCSWLVGYYDKGATGIAGQVPFNNSNVLGAKQIDTTIDQWKWGQYQASPLVGPILNLTYDINFYTQFITKNYYKFCVYMNGKDGYSARENRNTLTPLKYPGFLDEDINNIVTEFAAVGIDNFNNILSDYIDFYDQTELGEFLQEYPTGTLIQDATGLVYKVNITQAQDIASRTNVPQSSAMFQLFTQVVNRLEISPGKPMLTGTPNNESFSIAHTHASYNITFTPVEEYNLSYDLTGQQNKLITEEEAFDIFAIPYGPLKVYNANNELICQTDPSVGLSTIMNIQAVGQSKVYDIQLLPYCPCSDWIIGNGEVIVTDEAQYTTIKSGTENPVIKSIIFNVPRASFAAYIPISVPQGQTAIEKKLNTICNKYRLCGPNYADYFDFSVEKNNGVFYFQADCYYKPYTPYVHVNPNFGGLYGKNFRDARGIILSGDFSLSQVGDAWQQYQIQNKNFQQTFDRQIQNMEVQYDIARKQEVASIAAGTAQGAAAGALTGSMVGGGYGAIAGAVVGGGASLAGGITDAIYNERLRNETLDYTRDMFGYQLQNIKALPQTIAKVSALNPNNKRFPILEFYTCQDRERDAVARKLAYNGMTTMIIDKIENYLGNSWTYKDITDKGYIKGKLIRLETIGDDFHIINAISEELNKGVFIK